MRAAAAHGAHDGSLAATAALKRLTSELVGRFVTGTVEATRTALGDDMVARRVRRRPRRARPRWARRWRCSRRRRCAGSCATPPGSPCRRGSATSSPSWSNGLVAGAPHSLDPAFVPAWEGADDDAGRLRAVVDQVAVLTDAGAERWWARLRDQSSRNSPPAAAASSGPNASAGV